MKDDETDGLCSTRGEKTKNTELCWRGLKKGDILTTRMHKWELLLLKMILTFRHRASCILGQAFHYSSENAFYIFNQQIYFII